MVEKARELSAGNRRGLPKSLGSRRTRRPVLSSRSRFIRGMSSDSIDYAVMEKITGASQLVEAIVIPLDCGWSDIGSWSALTELHDLDAAGNVVHGDAYAQRTSNSILVSDHRLVAAVGLDDVIVVETSDAVLVADRNAGKRSSRLSTGLSHRVATRALLIVGCTDRGVRSSRSTLVIVFRSNV